MNVVLFVCMIFYLLGCSEGHQEKPLVLLNMEKANYTANPLIKDYFDNPQLIKLETNKESLITEINRLIIYDNKLFIFDNKNNSVLTFNEDGKFLFKINRVGRGPGEYIQLTDFTIDEINKQIILLCDIPNCLIYLDLNGKFIRQETRTEYDLYLSADNNILYFASLLTEKDKNYIRVKTENNLKEFLKIDKNIRDKEFYSKFPNIIKSNNVYYSKVYDNIIYSLSNDKVVPKFMVNFGNRMIDKDVVKKNSLDEIILNSSKQDLICRIERFKESNNYLYFATWPYTRIFFYNKKLGNCQSFDSFYDSDTGLYLTNFIAFDGDDNDMIFKVSTETFMTSVLDSVNIDNFGENERYRKYIELAENLSEFDNPILIKFNIK
jgi:hypothetical protein